MWLPWIEFAVVLAVMALLAIPMGQWLARCFTSEHHTWLERCTYGALGVNPQERMTWQRYGASLLLSTATLTSLSDRSLTQTALCFRQLSCSAR